MKQLSPIKWKYYTVVSRLGVIKNEIKLKGPIDYSNIFKTWGLGYSSEKYRLYSFNTNDHANYLPDSAATMTRFINQPYSILLNNKIMFEKTVSQYIKVPKNYAFVDEETIFPLQSNIEIDSVESIINVCKEEGGIVIKPVQGSRGRGVSIIKVKNNEIFSNGKKISKDELDKYVKSLGHFIITEFIKQGEYSNNLYPGSTNTMRILIMIDPENHEPFIARAVQRIGSKTSKGLDNFTMGGYSANIDIETGILSEAATKIGGKELEWYDKHPDTGAQIKGVQVPRWDEIKKKLLNIMREMPYLKYAGWDIVLTDEDIVTIEGNNHSQVGVMQLHKPLLIEPRIKKFYKYYNII